MLWLLSILIFLLTIAILTSIAILITHFELEEYFLMGMVSILMILCIILFVIGIHDIIIELT